jgi:hypothetical protein
MHLDQYGLPCQADGNCEDQLNRVGLISVACVLNYFKKVEVTELDARCDDAISHPMGLLMADPGVYKRHANGTPNDVTCDQLVPVIAYHTIHGDENLGLMFKAMVKRFGFAQNFHKNGEPQTHTIPDFMLLRTLPLFARKSKWMYPIALVSDVYTLIQVISCCLKARNDMDAVDDNNLIVTLLATVTVFPTFMSKFAAFVYKKYRPTNYGVTMLGETSNVQGAMTWYHRSESGGNPEIAEMYRNLIKELL